LEVVVDNERQQRQQEDSREPWLWQQQQQEEEEEEEEEEGRGAKVGFLCTIVAHQVHVPNAQNLECVESPNMWVPSPHGMVA
jgi:hypothetical protein